MHRRKILGWGVVFLLGACGRKKVVARRPQLPAPPVGSIERGVASWYGKPYDGRRAADGEIYDMETMVAAHRTLPFQTMVRVRNLNNGKTVDVRIIDRGPFVNGRIIDLSHAAARQIELIGPGIAQVEITILPARTAPQNPAVTQAPVGLPETGPAFFAVQVAAFRDKANADRLVESMIAAYGAARAVIQAGDPPVWRVLAGRTVSTEDAELLAQRIRLERKTPEAFVVRLDP